MRNTCIIRGMRLKKGFTLVEMVVTLAIIGVASALTVIVVTNLVNSQNASSNQYVYSKEMDLIDKTANEFVSFVSVNDSDASFTYKSQTETSVTFTYKTYDYTFSFSGDALRLTNTYDGDVDYFKKTFVKEIKYATNFSFSFDTSSALLKIQYNLNKATNTNTYVVRTLL